VVSGQAVTAPLAHEGWVNAVVWSPDGKRVATASHDHTARVWDAVNGQALAHEGGVMAVAWSPDGKRVATASHDHTARVWDVVSGQAVTPPLAHEDEVKAVAWSPDGKRVTTAASGGNAARVWDVSWDDGTLADWRTALKRSDFRLNRDGALVLARTIAPGSSLPSSRGSADPN
jgi:WD40 repeat protein